MKKPENFGLVVNLDESISNDEGKIELLGNICQKYDFRIDYDCGNILIRGQDLIYELLESRTIYILRALKKENFTVKSYFIDAIVFDSRKHGSLI